MKLDEEAKLRRQKLDAVKKKKLEDLRYVLIEIGSQGLEYVVLLISTNPLHPYVPRLLPNTYPESDMIPLIHP